MKSYEETIPCAFCCNDPYAPFLAVSLASLIANTERKVKIYIFADGISEENKERISGLKQGHSNIDISWSHVDYKNLFTQITDNTHLEIACGRLLIPDYCGEKKIIYCDTDTIFLGDIEELYNQNLNNYGLGAVPDANVIASPLLTQLIYTRLYLGSRHIYFNSGVLLIDTDYWKENTISRKLLQIGAGTPQKIVWGDQDILNLGFKSAYTPLDHIFNYTSRAAVAKGENLHRDDAKIIVRHFESERKPWRTTMYTREEPLPHFEDFWKYAALTPFNAWLQETYEKTAPLDSPPEYAGNIFKPDASTLSSLRGKLRKNNFHKRKRHQESGS